MFARPGGLIDVPLVHGAGTAIIRRETLSAQLQDGVSPMRIQMI